MTKPMKHFAILADGGATKVRWKINNDWFVTTRGLNPSVMEREAIERVLLTELLPALGVHDSQIDSLEYYGAGCRPDVSATFQEIIRDVLPLSENVHLVVGSDLLGAAKALFGCKPGLACILGTGANSGLYDGEKIIENVPSLGYILGDEGSGAYLGKKLLNLFFKGMLSAETSNAFRRAFPEAKLDDVIRRVYRSEAPNAYLASFCPFIKDHQSDERINALVREAFRAFINRNLRQYCNFESLPIGFVGSIAFNFADTLRNVLGCEGLREPKILVSPL